MDAVSVIAVIPARYGSSRLPGKGAGRRSTGVPMVVRVWRQTRKARSLARVIVATDDERIAARGARGGWRRDDDLASSHQSGTDRIAEVAANVSARIFISTCRATQPFIAPDDLDALAAPMRADAGIAMATLATPIVDAQEWQNPNEVKVVCDARGRRALLLAQPDSIAARRRACPRGAAAYRRLWLSARLSVEFRRA